MKRCWECEHRSKPDYCDPCKTCLKSVAQARMIICNLRNRGATIDDLVAEITFRQGSITVSDEKFFGYANEELKIALTYWDDI